MSLFGALSASLTALTAQSSAVNIVSNNISNLGTAGFKSSSSDFSTLIAGNVGGGVLQSVRNDIDLQGALNSTNIGTDLAVQGDGFFVVQNLAGETLYTRAGSFRTDNDGNLVNRAGYRLMGWPLDSAGRVPGDPGNNNTTSSQDIESLEIISESTISGRASPTNEITAQVNLDAGEQVLEGAGANISIESGVNAPNSNLSLIVPESFAAGDTFTVTLGDGTSNEFTYGGYTESNDITAGAGIGGVTQENATFTGFTDGDDFTISVNGGAAITYTFNSASNTSQNQFRNLSELAQIIESTEGLRARISGGVLYVAGENANHNVDFADPNTSGLVTAFGFANVAASGNTNRFATLQNLADAINNNTINPGMEARLINPSGNAQLRIFNIDPTDTITFSDTITSAADTNQILTSFNLDATTYNEVYDPLSIGGSSIASGAVSADFSRSITIFDSLGQSLNLSLAFTRITDNDTEQVWAVELFATNPDDVTDEISNLNDGLLSYGTVSFNGDGSLQSRSGPISGDISINPAGGATAQTITINLGSENDTDGLSQFAGGYNSSVDQDGFPTGQLQELQIDAEGIVTAIFDNSLTSQVYKLPLAYFANPNALSVNAGNAYTANSNSGDANFGQVGEAAVGTIVPGALENSTAEIGLELTSLIVFQQGYSASTNVLRKVTELFEELRNL